MGYKNDSTQSLNEVTTMIFTVRRMKNQIAKFGNHGENCWALKQAESIETTKCMMLSKKKNPKAAKRNVYGITKVPLRDFCAGIFVGFFLKT